MCRVLLIWCLHGVSGRFLFGRGQPLHAMLGRLFAAMLDVRWLVEFAEMYRLHAELFCESERPLRGVPGWVRSVRQFYVLYNMPGRSPSEQQRQV